MEVLVRTYRARRPNGVEVLVDEYQEMIDTSARFTGESYAPGGRRFVLRTGETVHKIDEGIYQVARTGEVVMALELEARKGR